MSETFMYPTVAAVTKTLTFESASGAGGADGQLLSSPREIIFNQIVDKTVSGIRLVRNLGEHFDRWSYTTVIHLSSTTYTDWSDILDFFGSGYANGGESSFQWTDYDSTVRTVRLVSVSIPRTMISGDRCQIMMILEEINY